MKEWLWLNELEDWQQTTFPTSTPASLWVHLHREAEELAQSRCPTEAADCFIILHHLANRQGYYLEQFLQDGQTYGEMICHLRTEVLLGVLRNKTRKGQEGNLDLGKEDPELLLPLASGLLGYLFAFAVQPGFDLLEEAEKKFRVNLTRTWDPPDAQGVVEHVREGNA